MIWVFVVVVVDRWVVMTIVATTTDAVSIPVAALVVIPTARTPIFVLFFSL